MVRETTLNPSPGSPINGVFEGLGDLGSNVATLATLQVQLAVEDLRETAGRALPAMISLSILLPLTFAAFTTLLLGLAYWIHAAWQLSIPTSLLLAGLSGLVLSGILGFLAWRRFRGSIAAFRRSREELERNLAWLGTVITRSGR